MNLNDLKNHYEENKDEIDSRLEQFQKIGEQSDYRLFMELSFVILSSRSSAKESWNAIEKLDDLNLLLEGSEDEIAEILGKYEVSFENNKAKYIVSNRKMLSQPTLANPTNELKLREKLDTENSGKSREWLVDNIEGIGLKGASHFLRNIGYADVGIVSSHILSVLNDLGTINDVSQPTAEEEYLEIEKNMKKISEETGILLPALDLVLWSMKTGEVFK